MSEQKPRALCVGEVLIEMARGADGRFSLSCGGDTFNTAVYLARAGIDVAFFTAPRRRSLFRQHHGARRRGGCFRAVHLARPGPAAWAEPD